MADLKREKLNGLADIFEMLAKLCRSEYCTGIDESVIDSVTGVAKQALDVNVDYRAAEHLTGVGYNALQTRMSRHGIKVEKKASFPISILKKIGCNIKL